MYRSDVLYKLIPRIVNPKSEYIDRVIHNCLNIQIFADKRKFYSDTANKPEWYPANVPFKSPNHPKGIKLSMHSEHGRNRILISDGDSKMTAEEMREVLGGFMEKCQDRYYM